jgi:glycosyltransferase involved in cell wall biosynthesis
VPRLLAGLDIAALSSVHEGVPIVVLESMAAALPIVATDCGALRDLVTQGETGYLVPVGDVAALAARLGALAADGAQRARLGAAGRTRAERDFDIRHTAEGFEDLLTELTGRSPTGRNQA